MMPYIVRILTLFLAGLLLLPPTTIDAAHRRKKAKTTKVAKSKSKKSSQKNRKTKARSKSSKRTRWTRRASRSYVNWAERRAEQRREDSIRLRIGGTEPLELDMSSTPLVAQVVPIQKRFMDADTTLSLREVERLYYRYQRVEGDSLFFGQIVPKVDSLITQERYKEALTTAEKGLFRNPVHIGLLRRACDLAEHEDSKVLDRYVWQIATLFEAISQTGDGNSPSTAIRVRELDDALLYEMLWLDVIEQRIVERQVVPYQGKSQLILGLRDSKGKIAKRYYVIE